MFLNSVPQFRLLEGHQGGADARYRDFSVSGHGGGGELGVRETPRGWTEGIASGEDAKKQGEDGEDDIDIGYDELLGLLKEDLRVSPREKQEYSPRASNMELERETAPNTHAVPEDDEPLLFTGPSFVQQEQQIAPHTPAVPEAHHGIMLAPPITPIIQELSWPPDLNDSGEGLAYTSTDELISMESPQRRHAVHLLPELPVNLDHDRPRQDDGSVLASNWTPAERLSPDVSRHSRSNSSSPIAMFDGYNFHNEFRFSPSLGQNCFALNPRASSAPAAHPVVDLTSDSSDGEEEESELREINGGSRGKRKLPSWAGMNQKRPRELAAANWHPRQPASHPFPGYPSSAYMKKAPDVSSLPSRSLSWKPSTSKFSMELGRRDSSVTTTSSLRDVPGRENHANFSSNRGTHSSSIANIGQLSSFGEVGISYERARPRVLPGTLNSPITGIGHGVQHAAGAAAAVDPALALKRSEELAYQAVLQAFSLADEKEETTPDDGLLAMSLLKHQKIALSWMVKRESGRQEPCGGILADDQGLGKTISTIALILKNRAPIQKPGSKGPQPPPLEGSTVDLDDDDDEPSLGNTLGKFHISKWPTSLPSSASPQQSEDLKSGQASSKGRPAAGTLVVCPTSVLRQWAQEIRDKVTTEADMSVLVYHGSNRTRDPQELAKYDVVLSTYSIVSMEVPKQPLPDEKDEESKRNPSDYGFVPFSKPKKEKTEKAKKTKAKGRGIVSDGDTSIPADSGPLARVAWFRVVLDEAQSIKNSRTQVARAAWGLRAKRRWCLSGTPIQNSVDDVFSYFRFLRYFPWDAYKKFRCDIKDPVGRNPSDGYRRLQAILKPIVLRRTKTSLIDGKPIVNLPPRIVKLRQSEFSTDERSFYTNLETESRKQFQLYAAAGTVQSNYVNILWMLLRLRQACDHPMLVKKSHKADAAHKSNIESVKKLPPMQRFELIQCLEGGRTICHICQDAPEDPVVSICSHVFCRQCIAEQMANGDDTTCRYPKCRRPLNSSLLFTLAALKEPGIGDSGSSSNGDMGPAAAKEEEPTWKTSSKIDAVIGTLEALPKITVLVEDGKILKGAAAEKFLEAETLEVDQKGAQSAVVPATSEAAGSMIEKVESTEKAIVFSQWTSMLDLLEMPLKHAGLCYRRLDGTMSVLARDRAVSDFNTRPEVTVMIMSLKAASLGLNMVAACHVLLLDVWWNPTTEDQAIDRAHRIGQTRQVNVSRFTVKNTIEDRILALQERKRQIVASAFGENDGGDQKTRLTVEDLRYLFRV